MIVLVVSVLEENDWIVVICPGDDKVSVELEVCGTSTI